MDPSGRKSTSKQPETVLPFGTLKHPASIIVGEETVLELTLDKAYPDQVLGLHIHWLTSDG